MAFFGRNEPKPFPRPGAPAPRQAATVSTSTGTPRITHVAAGLLIVGTLSGAERVEIEGTVDRDVRVDGIVVVGPHGYVRGRVEARTVRVEGRLEGDLIATECAEVASSGSTDGDIEAPRVVIAEGAYFKGNVRMGRPGAAARSAGAGDGATREGTR
jgi:cytoskeletal protein CcmA (bactofilin family)